MLYNPISYITFFKLQTHSYILLFNKSNKYKYKVYKIIKTLYKSIIKIFHNNRYIINYFNNFIIYRLL